MFRLFSALALCFILAGAAPVAAADALLVDKLEKLSERSYHAPREVLQSLHRLGAAPDALSPDQQAFALEIASRAKLRIGDTAGALEQAERLTRLGQERGNASFECLGLLQQAYVYFQLEKAATSHELVRKAQRLSGAALSPRSRVKLLLTVAQVEDEAKRDALARQRVEEGVGVATAHKDAGLLFLALKMRADRAISAKDYVAAEGHVDRLLALARQSPYPEQLVRARHTEYRLAYAAGWSARATQVMGERIRLMEAAGLDEALGKTLVEYADLQLKGKDFAAAEALASRALDYKAAMQDEELARSAAFMHGLAVIGLGKLEEGKKEVQQLFSATKNQFVLLDYLPAYIAALTDAGDTDAAMQASELLRSIELEQTLEQAKIQEAAQHRMDALAAENRIRSLEAAHARATRQTWQVATVAASAGAVALVLFYWRLKRSKRLLERLNKDLYKSSNCDFLTGLYNRRFMNDAAAQLWDNAIASRGWNGKPRHAVFLLDIDSFKRINDEHGHAVGDQVIKTTAQRLAAAFGGQALVARWGGEEFLAIVEGANQQDVAGAARRALHAMSCTPVQAQGMDIVVTISMGACTLPLPLADRAATWDEILYLADQGLYLAKQGGKNRACCVVDAAGIASGELELGVQAAAREGKLTLREIPG